MEKKEQIQLAVIGVGVVVLAYFLLMNFKKVAKKPAAASASEGGTVVSQPVVVPAFTGPSRDKIIGLQEKRWQIAWGRDPFWALSDNTGKLVELQLRGISFSRENRGFAFINDQIVKNGDTLNGYTVSRIEKDKVSLTRGTQTFILTFSENR